MFALPRIGMLVQGGAVEASEGPFILREVSGNPIQNHADSGLMQSIDQVPQLIGATQP